MGFERYIVSEAHACAEASAAALEDYSIGDAGTRAYRFFYDEFADWYVEVSKTRSAEDQDASQRALSYSFEVCLKLLHPFVPHVTEYLWQKLFNAAGDDRALMTEAYPSIEGTTLAQDAEAVALFNDWKELVRAMRNIKAGPTIVCGDDALADVIRRETKALALLAKVDPERVTVVKSKSDAVIEDDAVQLVVSDGLEVFLPQ